MQDKSGNYAKVQGSTMGDLYRGVRDNGASVVLGTAGAIGGGMLGGGVGMVGGGALGSALGAGYDYYGNTKETNQETNAKEALMLMGENAGLSLIGDGAFAGVAKGAKALKGAYNTAQSGARAGKDMIDGIAVNGSRLKENIGDKLRKISPSVLNDLASQGSETSKAYAKELIQSANNNYDTMINNARLMPLEVNQGNALIDGVASKTRDFSNTAKNGFIKNTADSISNSLNNISKNIGSKEAALNQQDLLNLSFMNDDLANMARGVLANDPKLANKVGNSLALQDEALLKELNLNNTLKADELYKLREDRARRAYDEFGKGLDKLDELNPNGIRIDEKSLNDLIKNADFFGQNIPKALNDFLKELNSNTPMSATKLNTRIKELSEEIKTNKSYDFNSFLENLKQNLLDSMVKNATNPQEAKEILNKIRKDYADFKVYDKSKIGDKLKGSEKDITKSIDKIINETNPKKNYEAITKGLNDDEVKVFDNQIIIRTLDKHKINIGDKANPKFVLDYKAFMQDLKDFKPKSKVGQERMEVLKTISNLRSSFDTVIDGILNSKAKELGHGISSDFTQRAKTMLVNSFTDYIAFYFLRLWEVGKRAGTRIQMRRAFANINTLQDFNKASKNFIESIKDKALKEEAIKARKEFNSKVKDLIKGDSFFMDKPDPSKAKSDYTAKFNVEKWINDVSGILKDEWVVNLKAMAKKHPEMFKNEADVFRVIKEIKDNPTHFFKNYDDEVALIAKPLKDDKVGNIAIKKDSGKIIHINKTKGKDLERLNRRNKEMLTGTPTPATTKSSIANVEGGLLQHSLKNSTQNKPKTNLMDELKENIKNKEIKKKNKKSVKERLDEDIKQKEEDKIIHSNSFAKGKTLPLNPKDNSGIKESNNNELYTKDKKAKMPFDNDEKIKKLNYDKKQKYLNELSEIFNNKHKNLFDTLSKATNNKEFAKALQENEEKITDYLFDWIVSTQKYLDGAGYADFSKALMSNDSSLVRALESLRHLKDGTKAFIYNSGKNLKEKNPPKKAFYFSFLKKDDISGFYSLNQNLRQSLIKKLENYIKTNVKNPPSWINDLLNKKYEVKKYKSIDELFFG